MSRSFPASAALALVAIVALPIRGDAQPSTRRAPAPLQQAARALVEGRYDEVDALTDRLDSRDPNVVALKARAAIARGRYADAETLLRPAASRAPASEAALELGLLQQMLGKPDAAAILTKVAASADTAQSGRRAGARRARAARARPVAGGERRLSRRRRRLRRTTRRSTRRGASCSSRSISKAEALKSFQAALQADPKWTPALLGAGRSARRRQPAAGDRARDAGARGQPVVGRRAGVSRAASDRRRPQRRGAPGAAEGARRQSVEPRRARAARRAGVRRGQARRTSRRKSPRRSRSRRATARSTASPASWRRTTTGSTKRSRSRAARWRSIRTNAAHARRSRRCTCCAPATSRARGPRSRRRSSSTPTTRSTFNLLRHDGHARQVRHRHATAISIVRMQQGRGAGAAGVRDAARAPGARRRWRRATSSRRTGRSSSRSSRSTTTSPSATSGLPGMIGALGACFGRVVTMDSPQARPPGEFQWEATLWHELAHVDHAADVEPARAALADRRHFRLRGEARAARVGREHGHRVRRDARAAARRSS